MNTTPAVILNVQRQPGANVIEVVDSIKALLPQLQAALPAAVDVAVLTDRTTTIRASVADVEFELGLAVVLVVLVIFLFLRNVPATIIPSLSVPLSLVGTLAVMYLAGFSLNNLSLMALTIATGLRRRRRDRHDREHRALHRGGRPAAGGGAQGLGADRLHHHLADDLADRGADPAAVHGRCRRPPVPRIRHHPGGDDPHLGGRVADPGADAVRQAAAPSPRRRVVVHAPDPARVRLDHRPLRRGARLGARPPAADPAGRRRHAGADRVLLHRDPEGLLSGPGYRADPGHLRGGALGLVRGDGRAPAGAGRRDPQGPRCRQPVVVHRRRRHQFDAQHRPHADQPEAA